MKGFLLLTFIIFIHSAYTQTTTTTTTATNSTVQRKLIPYGPENGDATLASGDDQISPPIYIPIRFPFFNHKYDEIKIQINGIILFGNQSYQLISFTPQRFPVNTLICVAPFWADIITTDGEGSGIFYRQIIDENTLAELDRMVGDAFPGQITHQFIWAFVVTWHEVPGYGLPTSYRNTFQAILATNGISSFAIYNFEKLQWTSGSASNNIHAQAGFNAGDLVNYFLINKSFSPAIVTIVNDSNINYPGRFIFSVGGDITDVECNTPDGLQVAPFRGSPEGGYEIRLYGICFNETNYIIKTDRQIVTDCQKTGVYLTCIMPMIYNGPTIPIEIFTMRNELIASTNFLIDIPEDNSELLIENSLEHDSFIEMAQNDTILLQFKKNSVTNNYMFSIRLFYYESIFSDNNELISISSRQRILYSSVNLSSLETLTIRYNDVFLLPNHRADINDISITWMKVKIQLVSNLVPAPIRIIYKIVSWTATAIKVIRNQCEKWEAKLPELPPPSSYQSQVPRCPCRVPAVGQNRFPLTFNNFQTDSSCNAHKLNSCQNNIGASHCYRRSFAPNGPGMKCCYNTNGMIITNLQSGAGGLEVRANSGGSILQRIKHALFDELPAWACCKLPQIITQTRPESCNRYHEQRPSFQCENVPLPIPGGGNGDPHFTTLDGVDYTFNGYGEYVLVRTNNLSSLPLLEVQIRTQPIASDSSDNQATAIVAFVIKNDNYSKVQFELFNLLNLLEIRINDQPLDSDVFFNPSTINDDEINRLIMSMSRTIQFDNNQMSITQSNRTNFKITYSNNIQFIVTIRDQYDLLNLITILPKSYEKQCQGLLNDENLLLIEQNDEENFFRFGESWRVKSENTIFKYTSGENYHTHQNLDYRPIFQNQLFRQYENTPRLTMARQTCQTISTEKGQQQCIYDILITNDQTMGELHENFQSNLNEWKDYAALINNRERIEPNFSGSSSVRFD
jgi:hypothetical protein